MPSVPLPPSLLAAAPVLVRQLGLILFGLAAVIARRFLRRPSLVALIVPLYGRLTRAVRRFERAVTRPVVARSSQAGRARGTVAPPARLPAGRGWLVRELGWEVVAYGSQLQHLLTDPDMQAALDAVPAVGRILRPLCRMLGVAAPAAAVAVAVAVTPSAEMPTKASEVRPAWPPAGEADRLGIVGISAFHETTY